MTELDHLRRWLAELDRRAPSMTELTPSVIVTPIGLEQRTRLEQLFTELQLGVLARLALPRWARCSTAIQVVRRDDRALERALIFEQLWRARAPDDHAERWTIAPESHARLASLKRALRARLHNVQVDTPLLPKAAALHSFHLADEDDVEGEARRLQATQLMLSGETAAGSRT